MGDCVGYLFKYITKAEPRLSFALKQEGAREVRDEATQYQNARIMGSCEAAGRLLSMPHHSKGFPLDAVISFQETLNARLGTLRFGNALLEAHVADHQ